MYNVKLHFSKFVADRNSQVKSSHLYLYSAFNNTDCVKALNSIKLEDRVSVMYNNKIKHSNSLIMFFHEAGSISYPMFLLQDF